MPTNQTTLNKFNNYYNNTWWLTLAYGAAYIILGIYILASPVATFTAALFFVGVFSLISGMADIIFGVVSIGREGWYAVSTIILGVLAVILGLIIFKNPIFSALTFIYFLGIWLIFRGTTKLFRPSLKRQKYLFAISGILNVLAGVSLLYRPIASGIRLFWVLGLFALINGSVQIVLALRQKNLLDLKHSDVKVFR
jgi:uncharacterized membrane protein HdeD (DUF308 family)